MARDRPTAPVVAFKALLQEGATPRSVATALNRDAQVLASTGKKG